MWFSLSRYRRSVETLMMYLIIIADIAPMIPDSLMHFNWPRLLRISFDIWGLFTSPIIKGFDG